MVAYSNYRVNGCLCRVTKETGEMTNETHTIRVARIFIMEKEKGIFEKLYKCLVALVRKNDKEKKGKSLIDQNNNINYIKTVLPPPPPLLPKIKL
jgi:hypothetical protein